MTQPSKAPVSFWILCGIGLCLRLFLATATRGSADAEIWTEHAAGVHAHGLIAQYARDGMLNHPPFMAIVMSKLYAVADHWHIEFRAFYRPLFALVDMLDIWLLLRILADRWWRYLAAGLYAVAPVALVLGAMHGNTDVLLATISLATCLAVGGGRPVLAGLCIGIGAWIKVPALFLAPAFGFAFPAWRDRLVCAAVALAVAVSTYLPWFIQNPALLWQRIFGYRGIFISTASDPPVWVWGFKPWFARIFGDGMAGWPDAALWWRDHSYWVSLPLLFLYGYLRRRENSAHSLAVTAAGSYAIFYALSETWAFQYFAWSMPFWFVAGLRFGLAANLFAGGYIYGIYAFVCDDWLLRPYWGFNAPSHVHWPFILIALRDLAHGTFAVMAFVCVRRAWRDEWTGRGASRMEPPAVKRPKRRKSR